jgi:hypothetical protein
MEYSDVVFNTKNFNSCYTLVEDGELGKGACSELFLVNKKGGNEGDVYLCKKYEVESLKAEIQIENQLATLPLVAEHESICTLYEVFDMRKVVQRKSKEEIQQEEALAEAEEEEAKISKYITQEDEPDPEILKAMANEKKFAARMMPMESDSDSEDYGKELR